jgi:hypothetical protein
MMKFSKKIKHYSLDISVRGKNYVLDNVFVFIREHKVRIYS